MIAPVQANQPTLFEAVHQAVHHQPLSHCCQFDHARNRMERRELKVYEAAPLLATSSATSEGLSVIQAVVQV